MSVLFLKCTETPAHGTLLRLQCSNQPSLSETRLLSRKAQALLVSGIWALSAIFNPKTPPALRKRKPNLPTPYHQI